MAKLDIVTVPSKILRKKASKIKKIDKNVISLMKDMIETLRNLNGLGLAAPQIGESLRLIIIESKSGEKKNGKERPAIPLTVIINPEIIEKSDKTCQDEEGCFSVPEIWGTVERPESLTVKGLDASGKKIKIKATGIFARVLQHEIDHLDGILFTDKADFATLHKIGPKGEVIKIEI